MNVEPDFGTSAAIDLADRVLKLDPTRDHRGKVGLGRDAELDVDVGQAKVTVNQQRAAAHLGEAGGEGGGQPGFPDAPFPGGDRDDGSRRHARTLVAFPFRFPRTEVHHHAAPLS